MPSGPGGFKAGNRSVWDFARGIAVPSRDLHSHIAGSQEAGLAAEAGFHGDPGRLVEHVRLAFLIERGQMLLAFKHIDMTGGASADAAAGVFEVDPMVEGHIQDGAGLTMVTIGDVLHVDRDGLVQRQEGEAYLPDRRGFFERFCFSGHGSISKNTSNRGGGMIRTIP